MGTAAEGAKVGASEGGAASNEAPRRAGSREWLGLAVLALPALLLSLDVSVLLLALPELSADLDASATQQLWIADVYGFMVAGCLVTMGTLGDRIGRRKLLLAGAAAFGIASVLAAYASSPEMLIAMRALLGVAGATVMPSTLALVGNMFRDPGQQAVAIAVSFSCFMAGGALGPVAGGLLLQWFWWGSVFLLGVPVMILLLAAGPVLLPEYRDRSAGRIDLPSVALSLMTLLPVIYGLKELAKNGWDSTPLLAVAVGVVGGVLFVRRQHLLDHPLLDLRLFSSRAFTSALTIMLFGGIVMGGAFLVVTQYLQLVEGLSPLAAGLWMVPATVAMIVGVMIAPVFARSIRPAYVMAVGMAVSAVGYVVVSRVESAGSLGLLVLGFTVALFGAGLPGGLGIGMIVGSAPPERAGSAASASETSQELGLALGFAILGTLGTAVYRGAIGDAGPSGLSVSARESLAGAVAAAQARSGSAGTELLGAAQGAFTESLGVVAGVSAVLSVGLAVLCVATLRHVPATGR